MTTNAQGKQPFSRHPLFPAIVALWSAALLGLGSQALPTWLVEKAVTALHVDRLVPAARPPLGFTAMLLLSLGFALLGALAGYVAAWSLARPNASPRARVAEPVASYDSEVAEEVEEDEDLARLEAARNGLPLRRRTLTSEVENAPPPVVVDPLAELPPVRPAAPPILSIDELGPITEESYSDELFVGEPELGPAPAAGVTIEAAPAPRSDTPLIRLGLDELVERFTRALQARRRREAAAPVMVPAPIEPAPVEPAAKAPFAGADHAAVESAADDRPFDMPPSVRNRAIGDIEWFGEEEDATAEDPSYSSLLDLKAAPRQDEAPVPFVRVEHEEAHDLPEPVVIFPGQEGQPPRPRLDGRGAARPVGTDAGTDDALRHALSALQRMSGAA